MNFTAQMVLFMILGVSVLPGAYAQDRDRDRDQDNHDGDRVTKIERGVVIPVRTNDTIDVERKSDQIYTGIVDQDVRGSNGRLAIPRGSRVELIVRVAQDNDLVIDFESVTVNGQRYAIKTEATGRSRDVMIAWLVQSWEQFKAVTRGGTLFAFLGIPY